MYRRARRSVATSRSRGWLLALVVLLGAAVAVAACGGHRGDRATRPASQAAAPEAAAAGSPAAPPVAVAASARRPDSSAVPTLILLSFDGWRWDYHTKAPTPNLDRLAARGVRAEGLIPAFPSKTFPNHYTMVTGLYPEHHGIVGNNMYDPVLNARFSLSDRQSVGDPRWWGGEPIWNTVQRQGQRAATLFWPGSEAPVGGMRPADWTLYDEEMENGRRVAQMLAWLDRPAATRPTLITGYFSDTDEAGHDFGPNSPQLREAAVRVDGLLGLLVEGIAARGLTDRINLVITSDHGMAETTVDRIIIIDDYLDPWLKAGTVEVIDSNPTIGVVPRGIDAEDIYRRLVHAHPHLHVYRKAETPAHWHYRDHRRIPAIVGVADDGWEVRRQRTGPPRPAPTHPRGAHGYDPEARSMRGIFVAAGPAFKRGVVVPAFENIHVYNVLAAALQVQPAPNDGDPAVARTLLATR